ncbi:hypothetical protein PMIN06_000296 [Paraphaeosphaeria minitans]
MWTAVGKLSVTRFWTRHVQLPETFRRSGNQTAQEQRAVVYSRDLTTPRQDIFQMGEKAGTADSGWPRHCPHVGQFILLGST